MLEFDFKLKTFFLLFISADCSRDAMPPSLGYLDDTVYNYINDSLLEALLGDKPSKSEPRGWCFRGFMFAIRVPIPFDSFLCGLEVIGSIDGFYAPKLKVIFTKTYEAYSFRHYYHYVSIKP